MAPNALLGSVFQPALANHFSATTVLNVPQPQTSASSAFPVSESQLQPANSATIPTAPNVLSLQAYALNANSATSWKEHPNAILALIPIVHNVP